MEAASLQSPERKQLTLVAAMARNRAIGLRGTMPWHLPAELAHFKVTTMGKSVIMGRKTWEAIGRPLPGRQNIVVTRDSGLEAPGCDIAFSIEEAVAMAESDEVMIIGGGSLYEQALPLAQRMVLTHIECEVEADTFFPSWAADEWVPVSREHFASDNANGLAYDIIEYQRRPGVG
ncbi:MAG: type 3 dihydrofolate reductase [Xanthomonadales bacterium]|nr:type 3 dihydrofolate reductase [Xanthomonadales bacterium]